MGKSDTLECIPSAAAGKAQGDDRLSLEQDGAPIETSAACPQKRPDVRDINESPSPSPMAVPVPASPPLSVQVPSSPPWAVQLPFVDSYPGESCAQPPAPADAQGGHDH